MSPRAGARLAIDELDALRLEVGEGGSDVRDPIRDVVQPRPALLQEARDRRLRALRLDQLEPRAFASRSKSGIDSSIERTAMPT